MTWLAVLKLVLQLAGFIARRAERNDIAEALGAQLEASHGKRVDAAVAARERYESGGLPLNEADRYRRD